MYQPNEYSVELDHRQAHSRSRVRHPLFKSTLSGFSTLTDTAILLSNTRITLHTLKKEPPTIKKKKRTLNHSI